MIPKIIHYCWFGGGEFPEKMQRCFSSWKTYCSDYEIKEWNESNSPLDIPYLQTALENRKWANASNLVRLWAVIEHGGLYFDTDIELLKNMDSFLSEKCFFGWQDYRGPDLINNAIFGAMPGHQFIRELRDELLSEFDGTEEANTSSPTLVTRMLIEKGLNLRTSKSLTSLWREYRKVKIRDVSIFPRRYFYPYLWDKNFTQACIKKDTYCIHHWTLSWHD